LAREKNSMTQGEAEAYARGFNDAREAAAKLCGDVAASASRRTSDTQYWAACTVLERTIRDIEPTLRPEPTGLEYRGG
jgi:hypothetical protein